MPIVAPTLTAVSLTDLKAHLNITTTANDTELQRFLAAATTAERDDLLHLADKEPQD